MCTHTHTEDVNMSMYSRHLLAPSKLLVVVLEVVTVIDTLLLIDCFYFQNDDFKKANKRCQ